MYDWGELLATEVTMSYVRTGILVILALILSEPPFVLKARAQQAAKNENETAGVPLLSIRTGNGHTAPIQLAQSPAPTAQAVVTTSPVGADFVGKLNVTIDGNPHHCTGIFVDSHVVLTAAHCVQQNGTQTYYTLDGFVQDQGPVSFSIAPNCLQVPDEWKTVTDPYLRIRFDYAFLRTTTDVSGSPKDIFNGNVYGQMVSILGYPFTYPLAYIDQTIALDVLHPKLTSVTTDSLGFTRGTSGGPWVDKSNKKIMSISSSFQPVMYNSWQIRIFGPVFDQAAIDLKDAADSCPYP
jgi:hypothetical protein